LHFKVCIFLAYSSLATNTEDSNSSNLLI